MTIIHVYHNSKGKFDKNKKEQNDTLQAQRLLSKHCVTTISIQYNADQLLHSIVRYTNNDYQ